MSGRSTQSFVTSASVDVLVLLLLLVDGCAVPVCVNDEAVYVAFQDEGAIAEKVSFVTEPLQPLLPQHCQRLV